MINTKFTYNLQLIGKILQHLQNLRLMPLCTSYLQMHSTSLFLLFLLIFVLLLNHFCYLLSKLRCPQGLQTSVLGANCQHCENFFCLLYHIQLKHQLHPYNNYQQLLYIILTLLYPIFKPLKFNYFQTSLFQLQTLLLQQLLILN